MEWRRCQLELSGKTIKTLKENFNKVISFLEKGGSLNVNILENLKNDLSEAVKANEPLVSILETISKSGRFFHVNLCHTDAEILNLPWGMAMDPVSGIPLNQISQLFISKNTLLTAPQTIIPKGGPLKILIMISSPKDITMEDRLHYEEEERQILKAFEPLFSTGEIQIDFADNGSLEALRRKIDHNNYHILHFSGHGNFDEAEDRCFLLLENPLSLKSNPATASEFAKALLKPDHTIPLVLLSSCQTAQARSERGIAGITGTLLQKGIPAVVSMGLSITDRYATSFASHFYQRIAEKKSLPDAFTYAQNRIKEEESDEILKANLRSLPMQWMIPNLYLTNEIELVDWDKGFEHLAPEDSRIIFANSTMEKSGLRTDQFVGRREDLGFIMPEIHDKKPIMLKGQGGIGKTTLARKLIQRLLAYQPNLIPFIFNEEGKEFSLPNVLEQLKDFCLRHEKGEWISQPEFYGDNTFKQLIYLLHIIGDHFPIILLFDNCESFQDLRSSEFTTEKQATLEFITHAIRHPNIYTILTGRYPIKELENDLNSFDLIDIDQNDFIRKCYNLGLYNINQDQMGFLYEAIDGNFRSLEFFHRAFSKEQENINQVFDYLESFKARTKRYTDQAFQEMAEDLIFDKLWEKAGPGEQKLAQHLYHFTLPVTETAFRLQGLNPVLYEDLANLRDLTLIQVYLDRKTDLLYYFMPPLVKNLLIRKGNMEKMDMEFHEKAGRYHYYMFSCVQRGNPNELEAAFRQFCNAKNKERVNKLGDQISNFYYNRSFYVNSLDVCQAVEKLLEEETPWWCGNRIGSIGVSTGNYELALPYFQSALDTLNQLSKLTDEEKENKGATLNNISQIYKARGDYDKALEYLQKSLKIRQEISDKRGEGATLNNISGIYHARGDYDKALQYLQKSLKISQEIGDKRGEGATLNNISGIYHARGDYDKALEYLQKSLKIRQEISDKRGEGATLNNISGIYHARGDYDKALQYLQKSLKISQEIGDKRGEGATLNNISGIYHARGDYDTALQYLQKSLKIHQEISDKRGEGATLNNISTIYHARGDYDKALQYLQMSLKIRQEIGDKGGQIPTLHNMAMIELERKNLQNVLSLELQAYQLAQETNDAMGLFQVGQILGQILIASGQKEEGIAILSRSFKIGQDSGLPGTENIKNILIQFGVSIS